MSVDFGCASATGSRIQFRWAFALTMSFWLFAGPSIAEEAEWIWSPRHTREDVPRTACYFRKTIILHKPERGEISLTADDKFRCYVNGRHVASGESTGTLEEYDITKLVG